MLVCLRCFTNQQHQHRQPTEHQTQQFAMHTIECIAWLPCQVMHRRQFVPVIHLKTKQHTHTPTDVLFVSSGWMNRLCIAKTNRYMYCQWSIILINLPIEVLLWRFNRMKQCNRIQFACHRYFYCCLFLSVKHKKQHKCTSAVHLHRNEYAQ